MINVQVFTDSTKTTMLADLTSRIAGGLSFGTSEHGFAECEIPLIRASLEEAFGYYDWPGTPHLIVSLNSAQIVYEGRVERVGVVNGGATITAYGYWRALSDVKYTALWSHSGTANWRTLTDEDAASQQTEQFLTDNNNRLHISLRKNERYAIAAEGGLIYVLPDGGSHNLAEITFTYDFDMDSDWTLRIQTYTDDFSTSTTEWSLVGNGATQTGTVTQSLTANRRVVAFEVYNSSGSQNNYLGETGGAHAKATAVRVTGEQVSPIYASDIVAELIGDLVAINATQLSSSTAAVTATTTDILEALYEDESPADIVDMLAAREGYQAAVWDDQRLVFDELGAAGQTYYVDASSLEAIRDLGEMANQAYALYKDQNGRVMRTAVSDNLTSQTRYGIIRQAVATTRSTSSTEAEAVRDSLLSLRGEYVLQAAVTFDRVYNAGGAVVPLATVRAGDTIVIRNLSPSLSSDIDNIRSFRIARTRYSVQGSNELLDVEPIAPVPTLPILVAQQ